MAYSTIQEFIQSGASDVINYHNLSLIQTLDDIEYPYDNVVYDYLEELKSVAQIVQLSDTELNTYRYRPDLLSYDIYGTPRYDFIILALNNIEQDKLFNTNILKLIPKDSMALIMDYIFNAEEEYINSNRNDDSGTESDKSYEL